MKFQQTGRFRWIGPVTRRRGGIILLLCLILAAASVLFQRTILAQEDGDGNVFLPLVSSSGEGDSPAPQTPAAPQTPGAPGPQEPTLDNVTVGVRQVGEQRYLVAGARSGYPGLALYTYANDDESTSKSLCTAECTTAWPPLTVSSAEALIGATELSAALGTVQREDGTLQVTYAGWPLYRYAGDLKAGDANGEGIEGLWWRSEALAYSNQSDGELPTENLLSLSAVTVLSDFAEANTIAVNQPSRDEWHTVALQQTYTRPVIVMQPLSSRGRHPVTIRVRNVTSDSFDFKIDEWPYLDGWHTDETIHYLAVEAGSHALPGGSGVIQAGTARIDHRFTTVDFAEPFANPPVVFSQIESVRDEEPATTRQRGVTAGQFELRLSEAEASDRPHEIESVGYIAVTPGQFNFDGQILDVGMTPDRVTHRWYPITFSAAYQGAAFLAAMQTADGGNPAGLRYNNFGESGVEVFVEEEQSLDDEISHTTEVVGYLVVGRTVGAAPTVTPPPPTPTLPPTITPVATPTNQPNPTPTPVANPEEATLQIMDARRVRNVYETGGEETEGDRAQIRIRRSTSGQAATVNFALLGAENPNKGSASADDYIIRNGDDEIIDGRLAFAAGESVQTLTVEAVADERIEVPEALRIQLQAGPGFTVLPNVGETTVLLSDGEAGVTTGSRLFVAQMTAAPGTDSGATGLATVQLSNDNSYGLFGINFSGLSSLQTSGHFFAGDPISGSIVYSFRGGQLADQMWEIAAAGPSVTDQAMLDSLLGGKLYVNVASAEHPDGELYGTLRLAQGTPDTQPPPPPDPIEPLTGDALERDIALFLQQATFGPTVESVADMQARVERHSGDHVKAYAEWIDEQMAMQGPSIAQFMDANLQLQLVNTNGDLAPLATRSSWSFYPAWYTQAVYAKAQLRERTAFALSEIFVVSHNDPYLFENPWATAGYYDMLKENAFAPYETLLTDVSTHPAMGWYLSHLKNQAEQRDAAGEVISSPDENYAREVMQLFSIGLVMQHRDGSFIIGADGLPLRTYDQEDITELARAFTGWSYSVQREGDTLETVENDDFFYRPGRIRDQPRKYLQPSLAEPLKGFEDNGLPQNDRNYERYHDNGEKQWLGQTIPAGQTAEQEMAQVMRVLSEHPNTAPFISYRLIQRFVMSNPSPGYIYRTASVFEESNGNLGAVVKAILLDPEARNPSAASQLGNGKVKEPVIQMVALMRLLRAQSDAPPPYDLAALQTYGYTPADVQRLESDASLLYLTGCLPRCDYGIDQPPLGAPTVFNWFLPTYAPAGPVADAGLVGPELQLTDESNTIGRYNAIYEFVLSNKGLRGIRYRQDEPQTRILYAQPTWLLDAYLAVMDSNKDGQLTPDDASYADAAQVRAASAALVDRADDYLCAGRLQAGATGNAESDPREIIITGVVDSVANWDGGSPEYAVQARDARLQETLFLVASAPQCSFTE